MGLFYHHSGRNARREWTTSPALRASSPRLGRRGKGHGFPPAREWHAGKWANKTKALRGWPEGVIFLFSPHLASPLKGEEY
ncbi:hypothetical protein D4R52_00900 [bacterium]|nr:MAG: hypothetical protein D4R52_00900 [bacterium]